MGLDDWLASWLSEVRGSLSGQLLWERIVLCLLIGNVLIGMPVVGYFWYVDHHLRGA